MTSSGHAVTRLRNALLVLLKRTPIRAAAAELPGRVPLDDALDICLALLELEPHTYPTAAARWGSRFAIERTLTLTDAQLTLAALATLPGPNARAGVEALAELGARYRVDRVDGLLLAWLDRHETRLARSRS